MKRRQFITMLGGAATWPLAARAQQPAMPIVGFLHPASPDTSAPLVVAFRQGLRETGHVEGQNVTIEYRWAQNNNDRLPELAADLVRRRVAVIATPGSTPAALAAKAATTAIPIVFAIGTDPVQFGLVESLNRPGNNVTGVSYMQGDLGAKRFALSRDLLPGATRFAGLVNPHNATITENFTKIMQASASSIGLQIDVLSASTNRDIDTVFVSLIRKGTDALLVNADPLFLARRVQLITLAARHAMPTIYPNREYAEAGGLTSYGPSLTDQFRQSGIYAGRILKGEKPAEMPVLRPTKFELVINAQTARVIGLDIPPSVLALADEVIE